MDPTLDDAKVACPPNPSDRPLLHELKQLEPALAGFPVGELLDGYVRAEPPDRPSAYRLIDRCLVNWIASLDTTIVEFEHAPDDALERVLSRQRGTRDALVRLKAALSRTEVVRPNRGQLC